VFIRAALSSLLDITNERRQLKEEFPSIAAQVQTLRLDALNAAVN
jgi:hypothetical protein